VGKPKRSGIGFSASHPDQASKLRIAKNSADHAAKEQQALALINQGRLQKAEEIYRELIATGTNNFIVYGNLATICGRHGKHHELIELLKKTIELNPNHPEAHYNLGNGLREQGDITAAITSYKTALQLNPNHPEAHNNLGNALMEQGDLEAAIAAFNTSLRHKPNYPEAQNNLGNALTEKGNLEAAITSYNTALKLKPNFPEAHFNLGNALTDQEDLEAAIASYNTALELKPDYPKAHHNLGFALQEKGEIEAAIDSYNKALELDPSHPEAHNNLGLALTILGDLEAAIAALKTALRLNPNHLEAHNNLGAALQEKGEIKAAIASYNTAIKLNPDYPSAHCNLSFTELLIGDYKNGLEKYEYRFQIKKAKGILNASPNCPQWDGNALGKEEKLLLVSEQGLGDTFQFMRYAIALRNKGIALSLCAPPKLHSLIKTSGIDPSPLTPEQANQVNNGCWIPLLSVSRHLEVSPDNPIITDPYIKTTDELIDKWDDILSSEKRPIIGINWQGNPDHERTTSIGRSLPLKTFAPIPSKTNALLVSLQKGFGSEQLETCSFKDSFVSCQDQISEAWDYLETAAIIANCDLVITSDTSVAHLAGGMGKTTWLLLKKVPEWRWGLEGDATFWYPSMRLFRQEVQGDWNEVMERVAEELQKLFGDTSTITQSVSTPAPES